MSKKVKVAAQLEKLQGAEWDSDSETEDVAGFETNKDYVKLSTEDAAAAGKVAAASASATAAAPAASKAAGRKARKAAAAAGKEKSVVSNVIYVGRVPHGFYEDQMRGFFLQFGAIARLRLSRNKRTGKSKHYAFVEFEDADVAAVVANTMNGYRLFDHVLTCHVIPARDVHERMFIGANKSFKPLPWRSIARNEHNAERSYAQTVARNKRLVKKDEEKRKILETLGIDYEFPGYTAQVPSKKKHVVFT